MSGQYALVSLLVTASLDPGATTRQITWVLPDDADPGALEEAFTKMFGRRAAETYATMEDLEEAEQRIDGLRVTVAMGGGASD